MKRNFTIILSLLLLTFLQSCVKDSPKVYPIVGLWIGTYKVTGGIDVGSGYDSLYYSFDIKQDSTIITQGLGAYGITYYSIGTWSLDANNFKATFSTINIGQESGPVQNATAIYNKKTGTLSSGEVKNEGSSYTASFELNRVN